MPANYENMPTDMLALAAFVKRKMEEQRISVYEVARRATAAGPQYAITHSTVWSIASARPKYVLPTTLKALARGLGVGEDELWAIARGVNNPEIDSREERAISLSPSAWETAEREARRTYRSLEHYLEALIAAAAGEDVNLNLTALRGDAGIAAASKPPKSARAKRAS